MTHCAGCNETIPGNEMVVEIARQDYYCRGCVEIGTPAELQRLDESHLMLDLAFG